MFNNQHLNTYPNYILNLFKTLSGLNVSRLATNQTIQDDDESDLDQEDKSLEEEDKLSGKPYSANNVALASELTYIKKQDNSALQSVKSVTGASGDGDNARTDDPFQRPGSNSDTDYLKDPMNRQKTDQEMTNE